MGRWVGSEIKTVCRISAMIEQPVEASERFVIPISKTMDKEICALREWARDRTLPATMKISENGSRKIDLS